MTDPDAERLAAIEEDLGPYIGSRLKEAIAIARRYKERAEKAEADLAKDCEVCVENDLRLTKERDAARAGRDTNWYALQHAQNDLKEAASSLARLREALGRCACCGWRGAVARFVKTQEAALAGADGKMGSPEDRGAGTRGLPHALESPPAPAKPAKDGSCCSDCDGEPPAPEPAKAEPCRGFHEFTITHRGYTVHYTEQTPQFVSPFHCPSCPSRGA